jgi:DNA-binding transcriptional ArsR family regulator
MHEHMKHPSDITPTRVSQRDRHADPAPHIIDPQAVQAARATPCSEAELTLLADTFQILANPTRLQIVRALSNRELCVGDLAAAVDASPSAVSHHLRQLRQMRLVRHRRDGKLTFYALDDEHVTRLFELGLEHVREELE